MFNRSPQNVNDLALEYLECKYGEKFEYEQPAGNSMTGTRNFIASCSDHGHVLVQIDNFKDEETRVFRDNHIAVKYEEKTRNYIKEICDKEFAESKVLYSVAEKALSEYLSADATFEQYLADPESRISAVIVVKKSDFSDNDQFKIIAETISESSAANEISIRIYAVEESEFDSYDPIVHETIVLRDKYAKHMNFIRDNDKTKLEIFLHGGELDERIEF